MGNHNYSIYCKIDCVTCQRIFWSKGQFHRTVTNDEKAQPNITQGKLIDFFTNFFTSIQANLIKHFYYGFHKLLLIVIINKSITNHPS